MEAAAELHGSCSKCMGWSSAAPAARGSRRTAHVHSVLVVTVQADIQATHPHSPASPFLQEILMAIKLVKFYVWESSFEDQVSEVSRLRGGSEKVLEVSR